MSRARVGARPRWKRILYLECVCVTYKREIAIEGYVVVVGLLTLPIWCWYFLPSALGLARQAIKGELERRRRRPFGGVNIAERNAVRQGSALVWGRGRRRSLSCVDESRNEPRSHEAADSPLMRLPEEIRREIFLYLVRPEDELTICTFIKQRRLVAVPTFGWRYAHVDARESGKRWMAFQQFLNNGNLREGCPQDYTCKDMVTLAKVNRRMYKEIIPLLYGENIFDFHPIHQTRHAGSLEHFLAFTHSIPVERLEDLRHIRLRANLEFKYVPKKHAYLLEQDGEYRWARVCDALRRMPNLVTLRIGITARYCTRNRYGNRRRSVEESQPENRILSQLIGVRAKQECVVEMPWVRSAVGELPGAEFWLSEADGAVEPVDESIREG